MDDRAERQRAVEHATQNFSGELDGDAAVARAAVDAYAESRDAREVDAFDAVEKFIADLYDANGSTSHAAGAREAVDFLRAHLSGPGPASGGEGGECPRCFGTRCINSSIPCPLCTPPPPADKGEERMQEDTRPFEVSSPAAFQAGACSRDAEVRRLREEVETWRNACTSHRTERFNLAAKLATAEKRAEEAEGMSRILEGLRYHVPADVWSKAEADRAALRGVREEG